MNKSKSSSHKGGKKGHEHGKKDRWNNHQHWGNFFRALLGPSTDYIKHVLNDPDVALYEAMEKVMMETNYTWGRMLTRAFVPFLTAFFQYVIIGYTLSDLYYINLNAGDPLAGYFVQAVLIYIAYYVCGMWSPQTPLSVWRIGIIPWYGFIKAMKNARDTNQLYLVVRLLINFWVFQLGSKILGGYAALQTVAWFSGTSTDIGQPVFRTTTTTPSGTHTLGMGETIIAGVVLIQCLNMWFVCYYDHASVRVDPTFHGIQAIEYGEERRMVAMDALWALGSYFFTGPLIGSITDPIFVLSTVLVSGNSTGDTQRVIGYGFAGFGIAFALGVFGHMGMFALVDLWTRDPKFKLDEDGRPVNRNGKLVLEYGTDEAETNGRSSAYSNKKGGDDEEEEEEEEDD